MLSELSETLQVSSLCLYPAVMSEQVSRSQPAKNWHTHTLNFLHWNLSLPLMWASLWDQGWYLCKSISCLSCISLMSGSSASVVVIFINWLLREHSKTLSIKNIEKNGRRKWWKSKERDFILRWRPNPFPLESVTGHFHQNSLLWTKLLTMCQRIPATHHFSSFTCLLKVMLCPIKTHTNKYKTSQSKSSFRAIGFIPGCISDSSRAQIYSQFQVLSACQD